MKSKIYIVRHTQTIGNIEHRLTGRCDYELTEEGKVLAEKLAEYLKDVKFDLAYASTSKRTSKTIKKLADLNNLKIKELDELCEMYFGIYDGMKWDDVNKINPEIKANQNRINTIEGIPEQEDMDSVAIRMDNIIRKIAKENLGKTILICSHGVAIEAFLRNITKIPFSNLRAEYSQKNTSINIVEYDNEKNQFEILKLNDKSHLIKEYSEIEK